MKPITNTFIIKSNIENDEELDIIGLDGNPLMVNKKYNPLEYSSRYGTIVETPVLLSKNNGTSDLKVGDVIFFHYLICTDANKLEINDEDFYFCDFQQIFAKVENGIMKPLNNLIFVEKIINDNRFDGNIQVKMYEDVDAFRVKVVSISEKIKDVMIGDTLVIIKNAGAKVQGTDYFWLNYNSIYAIERNDKLIAVNNRCVIKADEASEELIWKNLLIPDRYREKLKTGIVVDSKLKNIDNEIPVMFLKGMFTDFIWNKQKYSSVEKKDLIFTN